MFSEENLASAYLPLKGEHRLLIDFIPSSSPSSSAMDASIAQKKPMIASLEAINSNDCRNLIDSLPDECVTKIFTFLHYPHDRCSSALVSKKWLYLLANMRVSDKELLAADSPPPQPFTRRLMGRKANDVRLAALAVRAYPRRTLTYLCIMGMPPSISITDNGLEIIAKASALLKSLDLWDCTSVGDEGFRSVARWCKDLKRLHLINFPLLTNDGLSSIANNCIKLSALSIESCPLVGCESLEVVASKSVKLNAFTLVKCPLVQDSGIVSVVSKLPELTKLKIAMMKIGDEVLEAIRERGQALQVLQLEKIKGPTERGYLSIGAMAKLKSVTLRLCAGLNGESFKNNKFEGLKAIEIQRCGCLTDEVLMELSNSANLLKSLRLEECNGFTSRGIVEAIKNWRAALQVVSLKKCSIDQNQETKPEEREAPLMGNYPCLSTLELKQCGGVEDDLLSWMGPACSQVKEVSLVGMNSFTVKGLLQLLLCLTVPSNLKILDLSGCTTISSLALHTMVKAVGAGLQTLKLESCSGVDDRVVATIAKNCIALEDLNVNSCGITDLSLWCLIFKGKDRLQSLSLAGCTGITDNGLKCLEQMTWDNLKSLDIRNCPGISGHAVDSFQAMIWWCEVIY